VHTPQQPEVAVRVDLGAVSGEVESGIPAPVLRLESLGVPIYSAQHAGPRLLEDEIAGVRGLTLVVDHLGFYPGEWPGRGSGLERGDAGQRTDQDVARLGLPPCVHDRATTAANDLPVPDPGFGVDRLADRPEETQAGQVAPLRVFVAPSHERPDRSGCRVADRDAVFLDDAPEPILV